MGASGSFHYDPNSNSDSSEKKFDSATSDAERFSDRPSGTRNVFISFHVEDESQVRFLTEQAKQENTQLEFRDYSVKEPFDEKWRANVRERISQTSATIVMIGPETANRPAVNFEIEESYRQGKQVFGVKIYKNENHPIPEAMKRNNARVINWVLTDIQRELDNG